jgi:hypothetical protein
VSSGLRVSGSQQAVECAPLGCAEEEDNADPWVVCSGLRASATEHTQGAQRKTIPSGQRSGQHWETSCKIFCGE